MATNIYFSQRVKSEQELYENIVVESLKMYGQDVYYIPRDIVNKDPILLDDVPSRFNSAYKVEMYPINTDGFDGEGDLFTKFGIEIRDQATFVVSRRRWTSTVGQMDNEINSVRPREGDLIYLPLSKSLFQIMKVENEQPFYQLSNLPTYQLQAELFEYSDEDLDTGIDDIDRIERDYSFRYLLTIDSDVTGDYLIGEVVRQTFGTGVIMQGEVQAWSDSDNVLGLIHVGADDGIYHEFATGLAITGVESLTTGTVLSVSIDDQTEAQEQNDTLSDLTFLDFSESNPFGEPQ